MPEINTDKCVDYNSFLNELNNIDLKMKTNDLSADVEKVDQWIKNNWAHLQKGKSEHSEQIRDFETRLQRLANHNDVNAQRILKTFASCLKNTSYFEIAPQDILTHTAGFLPPEAKEALLNSNISPATTSRIESALVQ